MKTFPRFLVAGLMSVALVQQASAQVIVNEQFNYVDQAALQANWTLGTAPLSLDTGFGNPAPSVSHPGTSTSANLWSGSTFSLTPTDANPVRLTADIFSSGNAQQANTVGLRQSGGADPLFEMGMYRFFDNVQTGPNTSAALSPTEDGIGIRTINIGIDLPNQDWVKMGGNYTGWARWEATFTEFSVTTRVDLGITGTWDLSFTETGTTATKAFSQLRIHSPAAHTGGSFGVDNIRLEVIPEPSTLALGVLGGFAVLFGMRRRK
jgi:hypothetical protein